MRISDWSSDVCSSDLLAEKGYEATPALVNFMTAYADVWKDFPEIRAIYYVDGKPAPVGTIIRNPAYAKLLRDLAARGADAFYTGANAQANVKAVTQAPRNRSKMTLADLEIGRPSCRERGGKKG